MITKRLRLYQSASAAVNDRLFAGTQVEQLVVMEWVSQVWIEQADHWDKSYSRSDENDFRIYDVRSINVRWAPTGTTDVLGWVSNQAEADAIVAELEVLLEMVESPH